MNNLHIINSDIEALKPNPQNARTHSKQQIRQIADSIKQFGFTNPVLIDRHRAIVAGHGRVAAAQLIGLSEVPTICLEDLTPDEVRAYIIADNRLAENAGWDREILALELQGLTELDLDFDITITGFAMPEIDILISELDVIEDTDPADDIPALTDGPTVSRLGDLWCLGDHRLLCGDATNPDDFALLLDGAKAEMVFTDPPYNVPIDGHVCGLGKTKHREFAMASGEMSEQEFTQFLTDVLDLLASNSTDGSIHYICMDWRHIFELLNAGRSSYTEMKNLCIWNKTNGGMGSLYRSKHELVAMFKSGIGSHINNIELGKHGRNRTNVWDYAGINVLGEERDDALAMHPTVKPVTLVADAMLDCSTRGGIVLDCFLGSGTTLMAAERTGRRGYGLELDPRYVDVIIARWLKEGGGAVIHQPTGKKFDQVKRERLTLSKESANV